VQQYLLYIILKIKNDLRTELFNAGIIHHMNYSKIFNLKSIVICALCVIIFCMFLLQKSISSRKMRVSSVYPNVVSLLFFASDRNNIRALYLVLVNSKKKYIHFHMLRPDAYSDEYEKRAFSNLSVSGLEKTVIALTGIVPDYRISIPSSEAISLLENTGGSYYLNNVNTNFQSGLILITENNYYPFLEGIPDIVLRIDTSFSIWYNLLYKVFVKAAETGGCTELFRHMLRIPDNISGSRRQLKKLLLPFFNAPDSVYMSYSRMNMHRSDSSLLTPLLGGSFDRERLKEICEELEHGDKSIKCFPLSLQIVNTTAVRRLAARTAGILRLKKCDTREFLNFRPVLEQSIIVDRSGHSVKRAYVRKVTMVSNVLFQINYKEDFDFSVYIGNDYYAVKYFKTNH